MRPAHLWIDAHADAPPGFERVVSEEAALSVLGLEDVASVSIRADELGRRVAGWIAREAGAGRLAPLTTTVHAGGSFDRECVEASLEYAAAAWAALNQSP